MKKSKLKTILGITIVISTLSNINAEVPSKIKKSRKATNINYKIKDKTEDQSSISDGSKTERSSK